MVSRVDRMGSAQRSVLTLALLMGAALASPACQTASPQGSRLHTPDVKTGLPDTSSGIDSSEPPAPRFGVQLYSFRNQLEADWEGTLAAVAAMGVEAVEVHSLMGRSASDWARVLAAHGLVPITLTGLYEDLEADLAGVIADAKALGVPMVVCPWIPHEGSTYTAEDNEKAIALFAKAGAAFQAQGLRFFYHPHGYEFHDGGTGTLLIDQMINRLQPGVVDFQMDVFWVVNAGADPVEYLERFPGRFKLFHLKEMQKGTPTGRHDGRADRERQVTLGQGMIDFPAIVRTARAQGARWFFIEDESTRSMQQIPPGLAYLKSL